MNASAEPDKAAQAVRMRIAIALLATNHHLVAVGDTYGTNDRLNAAAKNIRIELVRAFRAVKFSVKSSRFSMGNDITVRWTDGPTSEQVYRLINKYRAGTFDGMTDSYTYDHSAWRDAFGETKYVHAERSDSDHAIRSAIRTVFAR